MIILQQDLFHRIDTLSITYSVFSLKSLRSEMPNHNLWNLKMGDNQGVKIDAYL